MIPRRFSLIALLGTAIVCGTALVLHGYLGSYSRYLADDFCSAASADRFGILRAVWYWYLSWTGRYSASALDAVFGLAGPGITPFVPAVVLVVWLLALTLAASAMEPDAGHLPGVHSLAVATIGLYVTLALSPNVPQSLYWGQGMRSIIPPLILSALYFYCAVRSTTEPPPAERRGPALLILGFAMAFVIGGFNETYASIQLGCLALACAAFRMTPGFEARNRAFAFLIGGFLGAALSVLVVALSPGNALRQAFYPTPPALPALLWMAWQNFTKFLGGMLGAPEKVLAILGVIGTGLHRGWAPRRRTSGSRSAMLVVAVGLGVSFACFVPSAYGLSEAPPDRTLLVPSHIIAFTGLIAGWQLGRGFTGDQAASGRVSSRHTIAVLTSAAMLIASVLMVDARLLSSLPNFVRYADNWDTVDAQIRQAKEDGATEVWIQPIANWAGLNEPNDNPKFWLNKCLKDYYGIQVFGLDLQ